MSQIKKIDDSVEFEITQEGAERVAKVMDKVHTLICDDPELCMYDARETAVALHILAERWRDTILEMLKKTPDERKGH